MKSKFKSALLLFSGVAILAAPAMAVTTTNGDLLVGFYQIVSGSVQANTYVFNLGQASLYRENALNNVSVSTVNTGLASNNIGADLATTFGSNWADSGTVYWSIFGGTNQSTTGDISGDVARTPYISMPVANYTGADSTAQPTVNQNFRGSVSNAIQAINAGANGTGTNVGNAAGAEIAASGNVGTSMDSFFPTNTSTQLSLGSELRGLFGSGTISGSTGLEGALDVYRYTNSTTATGVDLTVGMTSGNAALGVGQYIGTFTIDGAGNLGIGQISAVPEPSGALALGLIGTIAGLGYRSRRTNKLA